MKINEYDAIIFDLGGVLINLNYELTAQAFIKLGIPNFKVIYSQAEQTSLFNDFETGKISTQHFINQLLPFLPIGTTANSVVAAWNAMILDVPQKKIELLNQLKLQTRVFLLSNTNEIHMQKVRREWGKVTQLPMENFFEKIYLSYEVGMRKPDVEIFAHLCNENHLDPNKTLFIDDSIQHIVGAREFGLQTIHLTDPMELYTVFS